MKYCVADIVFTMSPDDITKKQAEKYLYFDNTVPEFHIEPSGMDNYIRNNIEVDFASYQYLTMCGRFSRELLRYSGIYLHASAVVVENKAYLFSAVSGTGKSTHTGKWLELFGESAYILNDDKPVIRVLEDGIYAYGTPWSGKHDISVNKKVPLQAICFIERDTANWVKPIDEQEATIRMYHASLKKLTSEQLSKQMDIIEQIINRIPVYRMGCTPTIDAAQMAYDVMSKGEVK